MFLKLRRLNPSAGKDVPGSSADSSGMTGKPAEPELAALRACGAARGRLRAGAIAASGNPPGNIERDRQRRVPWP